MLMNWHGWLAAHEFPIRIVFFLGVLGLMGLWETLAPCRQPVLPRGVHWVNNLLLAGLNSLLVRLVFPTAAVGVAALAEAQGWGLLRWSGLEQTTALVVAVVVLDGVIYLQHVMMHAIPLLWRLHRVHHADLDFDVTTGARFHPLEILLSMVVKFSAIVLLGPPLAAVIVFEVLLNATAMFNHSNVRLPARLDRLLRWLVVTPDMHRVHHSIEDDEANSNFGFNLPWWDRLLGTYRDQPRAGHQGMVIGIRRYRQPKQVGWLPGILALPFAGPISGYVINRRFPGKHAVEPDQ